MPLCRDTRLCRDDVHLIISLIAFYESLIPQLLQAVFDSEQDLFIPLYVKALSDFPLDFLWGSFFPVQLEDESRRGIEYKNSVLFGLIDQEFGSQFPFDEL